MEILVRSGGAGRVLLLKDAVSSSHAVLLLIDESTISASGTGTENKGQL